MKRFLSFILLTAITIISFAQKLSVERFEATNDLTARDSRYLRSDLNGKPCALVKVQVALTDVEFEGNKIGDVLYKTSEYWVYLPAGDKRLKVKHPNYLPLTVLFADYGIERLEGKTTYVLTISVPTSNAAMQKLSVKYTPKNAMVLIDGQLLKGSNGLAEKELSIGSHSYNVFLEGYVGQMGTVSLTENAPGKLIIELDKESSVASNNAQPVQQQAVAQVTHPVQPSQTASTSTPSSGVSAMNNASAQTFTVNGVSFTMIPVEGGTFTMGATSEQGSDAESDEKPAHSVTLSSYMIGETEVTQALWEAIMGSNPSSFKGSTRPVEEVSWNDCQTFINKLNSLTGKRFRLPTEAEWEYAARGGRKRQGYKYSGSDNLDDVAWYVSNSGSASHAVKTKRPNELGIYDMSGNVYEWCQDWYGKNYYSNSPSTNPTGPSSGSFRVDRGGGWNGSARICRSANRDSSAPDYRYYYLGLRLAL